MIDKYIDKERYLDREKDGQIDEEIDEQIGQIDRIDRDRQKDKNIDK